MTKLKTVRGAIIEFDLRSCDTIWVDQIRKAMHLAFVTGIATGMVYTRSALETTGAGTDCFDFEKFRRVMNDYATQVTTAQSEIEV